MRVLYRSAPLLLAVSAALAGCYRPPDSPKGQPSPTVPETPVANQVVLQVDDMH